MWFQVIKVEGGNSLNKYKSGKKNNVEGFLPIMHFQSIIVEVNIAGD